MTIKNSKKNISAEDEEIIVSITNNTPTVTNNQSTFVDDLTLIISQKNFINEDDEDNESHYKTINIPLSELARLEYLHSQYYNKSAVDDIMALYYTIAQIQNNYYSKTEVDNKIKVHFDVRNALPSAADAKTNYVYLIPFEQGEADYQEGLYKEYVYVESQNNFEMIGSTKLDLSPYLRIIDLNAELLNASNFTDLQDEVDGHSDSIGSMQTDIYYLLNKLGFSRDGIDNYNYAVVQDGYWFLSNVDYDYPRKRFVKINKNLKSLGIQVKGEDINIWINDGREEVNIPSPYNEDYDYSDSLTYDYIGALNIEEDKWESFDIPHGWINVLSITDGITNFANEVSVDNSRVLTISDYNDLLEQIEEHIPVYDTELADTQNAVQNSAIYAKTNSLENAITAIEDLSNSTFKNTLWDFIWGSSGFVAENNVTRGVTNLGSFIYDYIQNTLNALNTSISNQIGDAIDTHNTSNNAHSTLLNNYVLNNDSRLSDARTPLTHTHTTSDITNLSIPTKTSDLTNDSDYITSTEVSDTYATKDAIDNIVGGDIDLTGYVKDNDSRLSDARTPLTHTHTTSDIINLSIPTKTSDLTNDNGFITSQDISGKADISNIPTKTSDLTNDSDYITSTEVSNTYATKDAIDNIVAGDIDLTGYAKSNEIPTKTSDLTNDSGFLTEHQTLPTYATVATSGSYNDLDNKPSIPTKTSDLTNDGDGTNAFLTEHQTLPTYATVAISGDYSDLSNTPNLGDLGGVVTVEKQQNAESNSVSTYIVKQNGTQVGAKINIPKDFLVKSASVNTCSTTGTPNGFIQGDKYIDFIINSKDNDDTDEHLYINVNDLVDTYTAGTGLTLSNNAFNVNYGQTGTTACAGNDIRLADERNPLVNEIEANDNLNSYDRAGFYFIDKNNFMSISNTPNVYGTDSHTFLFVESSNDNMNLGVKQIFTYENEMYIRFCFNYEWSNWNKIANKSDIPTKTSDLTNNSGFITSQHISGKEDKSNIVTSTSGWNSTTSDTRYPSEKLVKNTIETAVNSKANISDIPTKTSDLTNDGDGTHAFLTEHQDISGKASSNHTHGQILNNGAIGSDADKPIITTTNGQLTTGAFGTSAGEFAEGNHTHNYQTPIEVEHYRLHRRFHLYRYGKVVTLVVSDWEIPFNHRDMYVDVLTIPEGWIPSKKIYIPDVVVPGLHLAILPSGKIQAYVPSASYTNQAFQGTLTWMIYDVGDDTADII